MAHRNQKNRRPKKNKRKKPLSAGMARLVQRLPNLNLPTQQKVLINPSEYEKMSEVILDFAQPLLDMSDNDEAAKKAIDFAIAAWNFAIVKERSGEKAVEESMRKTAKPGTDEATIERFRPYFDMLFQRKRELFPDNQRMIMDYEISESRDNFRLHVISNSLPSAVNTADSQLSA